MTSPASTKLYAGEGTTSKDEAILRATFGDQDVITRAADLEDILSKALAAESGHSEQNIMIWGPPGVGKTQLVKAISERFGARCLVLMLNMLEPTDLKGLPVPNRDTGRMEYWLMSDLPPSDSDELFVLFLDELNTAPPEVLNASMRLILERRIDSYRLPRRTIIVAAGNRQSDRALVEALPAPMSNRFMHISYLPLISEWVEWARLNGVLGVITDFLSARGELLLKASNTERGWPSPRSWARLSEQISVAGGLSALSHRQLMILAQGCVGVEACALFLDFVESYAMRMNPFDFLMRPKDPMPISDARFDLRLTFLTNVAEVFAQELSTADLEGTLTPKLKALTDGLMERLLTLNETDGQLMLSTIAQKLPSLSHCVLTEHQRFPALLKRYGLVGLSDLSVSAPLAFLTERVRLSDDARELLRACLREAV